MRGFLAALGIENAEVLEGIFPDETGEGIRNRRFRFCHIDVDVYRSARDVVEWVWERMPAGGIVVYDDYGFESVQGITRFVNEEREKSDRLVIHNLNGHAIVVKLR